MRKLIASERQEQQAVITWWDYFGPAHGFDARLLLALCNGTVLAGDAKARARQMASLKATGLRNGAPDLFLAVSRPPFSGLWLEMKRRDWKEAKTPHELAQLQYLELLRTQGYDSRFARGADAAISIVKSYLGVR